MAYDLIVIGTGPGGYVCAIRAAQLGLKTAVVEKRATFGGTCLNIGCIPSKALLHASELFEEAGHTFGKMGIGVSPPKLDLKAMMAFKDQGVDGNVKGVDFLLKKNKVDTFQRRGAHHRPREGRGQRRRQQDADAGNKIHRHRHGFRCRAPEGHRDRRKTHCLIDRRVVAAGGSEASACDRRRSNRARTGFRVAAAWRAGNRRGIP